MLTYESEMLPILSANRDMLGNFEYQATELESGFGIADMVFYNLKPHAASVRIASNIEPITSVDILRTLTALIEFDDTISVTMLRERLQLTSSRRGVITYLVSNGFIQEASDDSYRKLRDYEIGFSDVVAIEAKLKNWRRGLYQACRYKGYANKSYLALYAPYVHLARKHEQEFMNYNVGLIEVGDDGMQVVFEPRREEIKPNRFAATAYENALRPVFYNSSPGVDKPAGVLGV